jgi:tRNA (guanine9-N1)-methyltransferase
MNSWPIKYYETGLWESFNHQDTKYSIDKENTIYLSPDAEEPLLDFHPRRTNFIIGGLIDRTLIKYASYDKAKDLNI